MAARGAGRTEGRERDRIEGSHLCRVEGGACVSGEPKACGAGSCARSLLTVEQRTLPDHVCFAVMLAATELFAARRFPLGAREGGVMADVALFVWQRAWPLPVGKRSLARFAERNGVNRGCLPGPLIAGDPDAEIGIWVERQLPAGVVRLLGPVTRDGDGRVGRFGQPYLEVAPAPRMYEGDVPANERDPLRGVARELGWWYQRRILGQAVKGLGRPAGPRPDFEEREGRAYREAVAELRRSRRKVTMTAIATEMSGMLGYEVGRTTLQYWVKQGWVAAANETPK